MNDRDLVQNTLSGDPTAFRRLIDAYRNGVYGLAAIAEGASPREVGERAR